MSRRENGRYAAENKKWRWIKEQTRTKARRDKTEEKRRRFGEKKYRKNKQNFVE